LGAEAEIKRAVAEAVAAEGQGRGVAEQLWAWFEALSSGNDSLAQRDAVRRRLELLLKQVEVSLEQGNGNDDNGD